MAALIYAGLGLPVLPIFEMNGRGCACGKAVCASPAKHPRTAHGSKDATRSILRILEWWKRWPNANVAIATGSASGLVVLDADGAEGLDSLTALDVPATTWLSKTGRGHHAFFKAPDGRRVDGRVGLMSGLDVRGEGGYVVVPPSVHASGFRYEWLTPPHQIDLAPLPRTVRALLGAPQTHSSNGATGLRVSDVIRAGERNSHVYKLARSLRLRNLSRDEIFATVNIVNEQRCDPPLDESELVAIVDNAMTQPNRSDFAAGVSDSARTTSSPGKAQLVRLSDVEPQAITWLWPQRIPRGKLTLLIGDPGAGKSTISLDLISRLTSGRPWPDGIAAPLGNALLISAEDGIADTIRPRVDQLGGDPERVQVFTGVRGSGPGDDRPLNIATDVSVLEDVIRRHDISIVVIDPLSAYLGKTDSFKDADVRKVLMPVAAMAEKTGVVVLGIVHLTKDSERLAIYRALGSIAFTAAPRAIFAVSKDPGDEQRRLLVCVKLNLAAKPPALAFTMVDGVVEWAGPVDGVDADTVLSAAPSGEDGAERADADEFLRELMALEGVVKANDAFKAARQLGISDRSLKRAKRRLGVESTHQGRPGSRGWEWFWSLPEPKGAMTPTQPPDTSGDVAPYSGETAGNDVGSGTSSYSATPQGVAPYGGTLRRRRIIPWHVVPD